jgi:hypothetical protein
MRGKINRARRLLCGVAAGVLVFAGCARASQRLYWLTMRETLRTAERVGIMDPKGNLGGQILGFNYQREPEWVHGAGRFVAAAVGYGPAVVVSMLVLQRVSCGRIGWRDSVCGRCGTRMRGLSEPRCAACGGEF